MSEHKIGEQEKMVLADGKQHMIKYVDNNGHWKDLGILNEDGCLPCLLCGGYPRLAMYDEKTNYYAYCNCCGTWIGERVHPTEQQAIDAWNRRA